MANKPLTCGMLLLASALNVEATLAQAPPAAPTEGVDTDAQQATADEPVDVEAPGEIVIMGRREQDVQQATTQVISVLSSEDIARTGEGDIAGALGRVTGLSVVGGGFVYVRGLGDRYSQALLNGSPLPSPEPLRRAVPLDLFPTDVVASSLVQKTYSPNFPGEFGGGVINLTTLAIPRMPFLTFSVGGSGDTETTGRLGYDHYGSRLDWTGYDDGARDIPPALRDFLASGERISAGNVDSGEIAKQFVNPDNGLVQKVVGTPGNFSTSLAGGTSWMIGESQLGLIATAGFSNGWRTRDSLEQTPGNTDLSAANKDYRSVATENHVVANALLGLAYEFGEGNTVRWTNLYIHDTLKRTELSTGRWHVTYTGWDFLEQSTGWYERELLSTQLASTFRFDPVTVNARASYSQSSREAPFELDFGYARNNTDTPFGGQYVNLLSGQNRNYATAVFSDLGEDLWSGGLDVTWRVNPRLALSAGYDIQNTERDSMRRAFQIRAPQTTEWQQASGVPLFRPDYVLGAEVIDQFGIFLIEETETDPAFDARLRTNAGYAQVQAEVLDGLEVSAGARYERGEQRVAPMQVFNTLTNSGASTNLENDYVLPAATLTWKFHEGMQVRLNASKTIARPQFRELLFQRFLDPEANREYLGNPLLIDSEFFNAEARYEWYYAPEQRISVAGFYKKIDNPIEAYATYPEGDTPVISFGNAPEAMIYGAELEVQKYFPLDRVFGGEFLGSRRLVAIGNYTWTTSELNVDAGDTVQIYGGAGNAMILPAANYFTDGSPLTGQSDHLANLQLGVEREDRLSQQTILLAYASDRVISRGGVGWPDFYESPGLRVDFVARQGLELAGQELEVKFEARNIFGRDYREFQQRSGNTIYYNRYDVGTRLSLSVSASF